MNAFTLPRRQKELHDLLFGRSDVLICDLYQGMTGRRPDDLPTADMQRWLGPYITALNRNLQGLRVEPGDLKNSYRLVAVTT